MKHPIAREICDLCLAHLNPRSTVSVPDKSAILQAKKTKSDHELGPVPHKKNRKKT